MRALWPLLLLMGTGCLHTVQVVPAKAGKKTPARVPPRAETRPPAEEGRPGLALSPAGLMTADGPRLIQQALTKGGFLAETHRSGTFDAVTTEALKRFQGSKNLPRTGAADRETVRALRLKEDDVFRPLKAPERKPDS